MSEPSNPLDALDKLLAGLRDSDEKPTSTPLQRAARAEQLKDFAADYGNVHVFQPGELVKYKPGMKVTRFPDYGEPAIVMEMLATPLYGRDLNKDSGSPYFCEIYDMVVGMLDPDGEFVRFLANSRRFKPFA